MHFPTHEKLPEEVYGLSFSRSTLSCSLSTQWALLMSFKAVHRFVSRNYISVYHCVTCFSSMMNLSASLIILFIIIEATTKHESFTIYFFSLCVYFSLETWDNISIFYGGEKKDTSPINNVIRAASYKIQSLSVPLQPPSLSCSEKHVTQGTKMGNKKMRLVVYVINYNMYIQRDNVKT